MAKTPSKVNAAWLKVVSVDPTLMVDRDDAREDLVRRLDELREADIRDAYVLITGARGVGKSIFTRAAIAEFEDNHPDHIVAIVVDGRGLGYRSFLSRFAEQLAERLTEGPELATGEHLGRWLAQLMLLSRSSQITKSQSDAVERRYGVAATVGNDLLLKLQGKFSWEEKHSIGATEQTTLTVTDELLHAALNATLQRLADDESGWFVVVFFDDMDQAATTEAEEQVATLFRSVLDISPCVSLVHFRTETLIENVAREATEKIDLRPLDEDVLFEMLQRRLQAAPRAVRDQFPPDTDWTAAKRLAHCTGNPWVYLKWVHGLLRSQPWPPPEGWTDAAQIQKLVFTSDPLNGAEPDLINCLVTAVEQCDGGRGDAVVRREDLLRGGSALNFRPECALSEEQIEDLVRLNVLLPKHRFQPSLGYRMQPILDLLRPSVQAKL